MGLPVKNLRDGMIKVQVANDGGGNAGEVEVTIEQGNLSWSESRPVGMISDRGTLDHARKAAQDQLIELTFSVMYTTHLDPNSATPTLYEALTRQGAAAGWISQSGSDSDDYSVNVEFTIADPAGGSSEVITFEKMNIVTEDFTEGDPNELAITATAPLYWPDFWWTARDGLSPHVGGVGAFTRASGATFINSDGEVDYARSGEFRAAHHPSSTGERTGLLEAQRTNICLESEQFDGAQWDTVNLNTVADSIASPDGFTTADTLTASAGNGTIIQNPGAIANVEYTFSVWLKRKTGTGDIDLTLDGGAGWTTKAVTSDWTLFSITQTLANPDWGIRIVTNADAVYAWGAQVEASSSFASSYIPTAVYPLSQDGYLEFSGAAGNYASTPDSADVSITGDIDIRARLAADDFTPAAIEVAAAKWTEAGDKRDYQFRILTNGKLSLSWSTDGAIGTVVTVDSSTALSVTDGTIHWIRATLDVSSGNCNFYSSDDGENWTLLGAADQGGGGATSINDGTALLEIGAQDVGTNNNFAGKIYRVQVYASLDGSAIAFDADPQDISTHGATRSTLTEKANSAAVTVFANSTASATRVKDLLSFPLPTVLATPKELTGYASFVELGSIDIAGGGIWSITANPSADPRYYVASNGTNYLAIHDPAAPSSSTLAAAPTIGQRNELRATLSSLGAARMHQSIAGAAESSAAAGTDEALAAAWSDTLLFMGSNGGGDTGFVGMSSMILTRRTRTLEHLRKVG